MYGTETAGYLELIGLKAKKEEFTGFMVHMLPGNSFPQICVVSGTIISNLSKYDKSTFVLGI